MTLFDCHKGGKGGTTTTTTVVPEPPVEEAAVDIEKRDDRVKGKKSLKIPLATSEGVGLKV